VSVNPGLDHRVEKVSCPTLSERPSLSQVVLGCFSPWTVLHNNFVRNEVVYAVLKHLGRDAHAIWQQGTDLGSK